MAKIQVKGTAIQQTIGTALTDVAQITEFGHDGAEVETYDATTLDTSGAGREYEQTGYAEGGSFNFTIFLDPALAGHQSITDDITTPTTRNWAIAFADAATTTWTFDCAGVGLSLTGAQNDGLKADINLKVDQLANYAT